MIQEEVTWPEPVKRPSLAVCTASGRPPAWPYTFAMARLLTALGSSFARATFHVELGYATDMARNRLVKFALDEGFSHILFVDDDMSFPPDAATRLLKHGKPIMAANYTCRVFPVIPLSGKNGGRVMSRGKTGIEEVDFAPTGIMLIDASIFANLPMPWFQTTYQPATPFDFMSDDVWFCNLAKMHGHEVWIDHDLSNEIGHIGQIEFNHQMVQEPAVQKPLVEMAKEMVA